MRGRSWLPSLSKGYVQSDYLVNQVTSFQSSHAAPKQVFNLVPLRRRNAQKFFKFLSAARFMSGSSKFLHWFLIYLSCMRLKVVFISENTAYSSPRQSLLRAQHKTILTLETAEFA